MQKNFSGLSGLRFYYIMYVFQSTLPRRERHRYRVYNRNARFISIHAPTQGATVDPDNSLFSSLNFNPRSHAGSDIDDWTTFNMARFISIHAPTQGATTCYGKNICKWEDFNPRSHAGSDGKPHSGTDVDTYFNPRSHAGSDTSSDIIHISQFVFQSTLPRRERPQGECALNYVCFISIHAPT